MWQYDVLWQDDTLKNALKDLDSIIASGWFYLKEEDNKGVIFLEYDPSSFRTSKQEASDVKVEKWNSDKIWEFVRKLGIVERKCDKGEKIKGFLYFYQVVVAMV